MYDIPMYRGWTEAEYQACVEKILQQWVNHEVAVDLTKSGFHVHETIFLDYIRNGSPVQMDLAKLESMSKSPVPTVKKAVQAFLVFANYYRRLIENYTAKARPLIDLTKHVLFNWWYQRQQAFCELRIRFLSVPIVPQFDRTLETIMKTDASNQAVACMLSQSHIVNRAKPALHRRIRL